VFKIDLYMQSGPMGQGRCQFVRATAYWKFDAILSYAVIQKAQVDHTGSHAPACEPTADWLLRAPTQEHGSEGC